MSSGASGSSRRYMELSSDADQVEFDTLVQGIAGVSSGIESDVLASTITDDSAGILYEKEEMWMYEERAREDATSGILDELRLRASTLKEMYPFELRKGALEYRRGISYLYEFLLCASVGYNSHEGSQVEIPRLFERVSAELTANVVGQNANCKHLGWPNDAGGFKKAHQSVIEDSQELKWLPAYCPAQEGPIAGDQGVDYIVWKGFGCGRPAGQIFFVGQCACGNNWESKLREISDKYWKWFDKLVVSPVPVFAVPHILPSEKITETSREAGIVLDRVRLVLAERQGQYFDESRWRAEMESIISNVKNGATESAESAQRPVDV